MQFPLLICIVLASFVNVPVQGESLHEIKLKNGKTKKRLMRSEKVARELRERKAAQDSVEMDPEGDVLTQLDVEDKPTSLAEMVKDAVSLGISDHELEAHLEMINKGKMALAEWIASEKGKVSSEESYAEEKSDVEDEYKEGNDQEVKAGQVGHGHIVRIKNLYGAGTHLDVCGASGCAGGYEVSTTDIPHRMESSMWRIERQAGSGGVNHGDVIYVKSMYGSGTYLDACGNSGCGGGYEVSTTDAGNNRVGANTGSWQVERQGGAGPLQLGDRFHLKNMYGGGTWLDVCGNSGCGGGYEVSTTNHARGHQITGTWVIEQAPTLAHIQHYYSSMCLQAKSEGRGQGVEMTTCAGDNRQRWGFFPGFSGGTVSTWSGMLYLNNGQYCLDASERNKNAGRVHLWTCDYGNHNQKWRKKRWGTHQADTMFKAEYGRCLKASGGGRNRVSMWSCNQGDNDQHWWVGSVR